MKVREHCILGIDGSGFAVSVGIIHAAGQFKKLSTSQLFTNLFMQL